MIYQAPIIRAAARTSTIWLVVWLACNLILLVSVEPETHLAFGLGSLLVYQYSRFQIVVYETVARAEGRLEGGEEIVAAMYAAMYGDGNADGG